MEQTQDPQQGSLISGLRELRRQKQLTQEGEAQASTTLPESPPLQSTHTGQDVQVEVEGEKSFLGKMKDVLFGLASGPAKATDEVLDLSWGAGNFVREGLQKGFDAASFREPTPDEREGLFRFHRTNPETGVGKAAQSISQFISGFALAGTALKAARVLQGSVGTAGVTRPMFQGAVSDFAAFDAHEERLSNFVEQYPSLRGPITAYLAADKDDSMLEGRFKGMLEGLGLGVAVDGVVQGVKTLKKLRKASTPEEAIKAIDDALPQIQEEAAGSKKTVQELAPPANPSESSPNVDLLPSAQIKRMVEKSASATEAIEDVVYNINLNKMVFQSPQGSHLLKELNDTLADKTLKAAGPESHGKILGDSVADLKEHGIDYAPILAHAGDDPKAIHAITRRVLSHRNILHTMTTEASRLSAVISEGRASLVEQAQFVMLSKNLQEMHLSLADVRTELGRALSSLNAKVDGDMAKNAVGEGEEFLGKWFGAEGLTNDDAAKWLAREGWTPDNLKRLAVDVQLMEGNSSAINTALKHSKGGTWWGIATEVRIEGLLSGPLTWGANGLGNLLKTVIMPSEKIIGGLLLRDKEAIRAGTQTYVGLTKYLWDSFSMMGKAFKVGENILDAKGGIMETPTHQMSYDNIRNLMLKGKPEGTELPPIKEVFARSMGYAGTVVRIPSRIMIATDELFKQLNFRAAMYAKLYGDAVGKEGLSKADDIAYYVESNMRKAFSADGAVAKGELTADSLMYAQRSTWTQALEEGTLGNWVQTGASKHPVVRLLVPFVKTPTNIIRDFWQHTVAAPLYREFREAYARGGEERARVLGQVAMGQMTAMTGVMLAYNGLITGSPPKDKKLRQALETTGWQPYSLKIGDRYISYRRIDPVGMFLGQAADVVAVLTGKDDLTDLERDEVVIGLMASVVNNITSKTYMQGISETINALQNPERYGESYIGRMAATFVPYSSLLRTVRKEQDTHMREMDSIPDYIMNTVPGLSNSLPVRNHWVTGNPVDYRLIGQESNDLVLTELQHLGKAVVGAPLKKIEGVKLSATQYSKLCELHGTVKIQGMTMHQAMEKLFSSPGYDRERRTLRDSPDGMESPRSNAANKIIDRFRKAATQQLLREDPELLGTVNEEYRNRKLSKRGALTKPEASTGGGTKNVLQQLVGF